MDVSVIKWRSIGGYAWTTTKAGQIHHWSTDTYCQGLWRDGVEVLGVDEWHLAGYAHRGKRAKVIRTMEALS